MSGTGQPQVNWPLSQLALSSLPLTCPPSSLTCSDAICLGLPSLSPSIPTIDRISPIGPPDKTAHLAHLVPAVARDEVASSLLRTLAGLHCKEQLIAGTHPCSTIEGKAPSQIRQRSGIPRSITLLLVTTCLSNLDVKSHRSLSLVRSQGSSLAIQDSLR